MNKKVKKRWIEALLSGEYVQTKGKLCKRDKDTGEDTFCCLGVLCDLHARSHKGQYWEKSFAGVLEYKDMTGMPPEVVRAWSGVEEMGKLSTMNDAGASFKKIAKYIEDNL